MTDNPYSKSLEARILSATPLELVVILYDEAINAVRMARSHLAGGDIRARSRSVSKAVSILIELSRALNFEAGELSTRLAGVYGFMRTTLLEANFRQTDDGLATTERLLVTLREAWSAASAQAVASAPVQASGIPWSMAGEAQTELRSWSA